MRAVTQCFRLFCASAILAASLVAVVVAPNSLSITAPSAGAADLSVGIPVMGPNLLTAGQLANWYRATKRTPAIPVSIDQLASYYISEGRAEGVRGDLAFAQSIIETGYFGFVGSIVKPENYNYAGMGACDSCNSGRQFPSARVGVRAQIQHLRNFADPTSRASGLAHPPVVEWYGKRSDGVLDPALAIRNFDSFFAKGTAPTWNVMGGVGKWASTPTYGPVILSIFNRMLIFNGLPGACPPDALGMGANQAIACPVNLRHPGRAVTAGTGGYYILGGDGSVKAMGSAPSYGAVPFSFDIARDIAVMPDGRGYVVLDGLGGVHRFGSAASSPLQHVRTPYFGFDIARSISLTADGAGYYVLDGFGGVHTAGTAKLPRGTYPYWPGWDIARAMTTTLDAKGLVVLDGFGGVWRVGTVTNLRTRYLGFDIARDIAITAAGDGYAVLDGYGGIHRAGTAPLATDFGYAPFDRWRGFVIRNGRYTVVRSDGYSVS